MQDILHKKVLLISPLPPPVGGISNWTEQLLYKANEKNISLFHINSAVNWRRSTKIKIIERLIGGTFQALSIIFKVLIFIVFKRPGVVHICTSGEMSFVRDCAILFLSKIFSLHSVLHIHMGRIPYLVKHKNIEYKLLKTAILLVDTFVVIDQLSFEAITNDFSGDTNLISKIVKLPNFVNLKDVDYILKNKEVNDVDKSDSHIDLLYIGHVLPSKGLRELFNAVAKLDDVDIRLHIGGPYEHEFKKELLAYDLKGIVKFYGSIDKKRVITLMSNSSAVILPSYTEGFPNVVIEAMACSIPVLATDVGAIPEMLNIGSKEKRAGICFSSKSTDAICNAIREFIENRELFALYGRNGRHRVEDCYSIDIVIKQLFHLWNH